MATATDVPGKFDVVINGQGYILDRTRESTIYGSRARAEYSYTPTFVERQNVSNGYGDNAQDFFLTIRQRDWSLGEQQKFFRAGQDGRFWMGSNIDVSVPGQVTLSPSVGTLTFAAAARCCCRNLDGHEVLVATATTLYKVDVAGTITSLGVHGLGAAPNRNGMVTDGHNAFICSPNGGSVGIRKWDGSAFTTFSATTASSLAFLNNTLYGYDGVSLVQFDSAGTATTLFTWKEADGDSLQLHAPKLHSFGGKLLISFPYAQESSELWIYDGSGVYRLEVFPENFLVSDIDVLYGVAYIAGSFMKAKDASNVYLRPVVLFFDGSQIGLLWQANDYNTSSIASSNIAADSVTSPSLGVTGGRLIFTDETTGSVMAYNPAFGGVSSIGTFTPNNGDSVVSAATGLMFLQVRDQTTGYYFPKTTYPTSGYVVSSLIDFDSSLQKLFRSVKVEFSAASDGDGGSVDIAYQVDSLTGSWTTLQTGAVSGTEYSLTSISGHAIAVKVTINKGTSTAGPTLKSLNVRAAPVLTSFKIRTYNLDLTSTPNNPTMLQDGSTHPLTGHEQAANLITAITSGSPISITDRFSTYTAVLEPSQCNILEIHSDSGGGLPANSGQFIATIVAREV